VSAAGTVKEVLGNVNTPLECAGQLIEPGDVIVADDDGVAVVARREAGTVLEACGARTEREAASRERYAAGELSLDVNRMRERLAGARRASAVPRRAARLARRPRIAAPGAGGDQR
jgi:4-hydroxy-4-methyl-2-oxoglutarate aldolase